MNEIKNVVNANDTNFYEKAIINIDDTQVFGTNIYIGDKQVKGIKVDIGSLPNNQKVLISTGLTNVDLFFYYGIVKNSQGVQTVIPFVNYNGYTIEILTEEYGAKLSVRTNFDFTPYSGYAYVFFLEGDE